MRMFIISALGATVFIITVINVDLPSILMGAFFFQKNKPRLGRTWLQEDVIWLVQNRLKETRWAKQQNNDDDYKNNPSTIPTEAHKNSSNKSFLPTDILYDNST